MFRLTSKKEAYRCLNLHHVNVNVKKQFFPRLHIMHSTQANDVECAEKNASRCAMIGLLSSCIGEVYFEGDPGITHQLAIECHTTSYIAYFLIVFVAAFDIERMTRYLSHSELYQKRGCTSLLERVEIICGRLAMILFVFFFINGIHNHGFAHEIGPLRQVAEFINA